MDAGVSTQRKVLSRRQKCRLWCSAMRKKHHQQKSTQNSKWINKCVCVEKNSYEKLREKKNWTFVTAPTLFASLRCFFPFYLLSIISYRWCFCIENFMQFKYFCYFISFLLDLVCPFLCAWRSVGSTSRREISWKYVWVSSTCIDYSYYYYYLVL